MPRDDNTKRNPNQPQNKRGLLGQYDPNIPKLGPTKLTWYSDFAPFGIQFKYWFFFLVAIIIGALVTIYMYNPFNSDRDAMFTSIKTINKAIMLTDPQGTGDYFTYWDDDILAMFEEGIALSSRVGDGLFTVYYDKALNIFEEPYKNLIWNVKKEYYSYLIMNGLCSTPEEEKEYQDQINQAKLSGAIGFSRWFFFWNDHLAEFKELYSLDSDYELFIID